MPRFAANLGFTPLQPLKPTMGANGILIPTPAPAASISSVPAAVVTSDVPAAQFDWDSSGLVNPLHGKWRLFLLNLVAMKQSFIFFAPQFIVLTFLV